MVHRPVPTGPRSARVPAIPARLEADAIGVAQDTVIGLASSAPAATVGLTLAALAATAAYGGGPVIVLCAVPMLVIANAYRRLNLWNANCGASFEWVGRAINPYLGFLTGWLMIAAYITGAVTGVVVLAPSLLAVAGASTTSIAANIAISTTVLVVMLIIAVAGIKIAARTQVAMAIAEYAILAGFAVTGLAWVLGHHPGTVPVTRGWFSLHGIGGKGDLAAGLVASVYIFSGWDGAFYVNEEVKQRQVNPGRAALVAVGVLTVLYTLAQVGLQGVTSPARLQANAPSALVYVAGVMDGGAGVQADGAVSWPCPWSPPPAPPSCCPPASSTAWPAAASCPRSWATSRAGSPPRWPPASSSARSSPAPPSSICSPPRCRTPSTTWSNLSGQLFAVFYILTALACVTYYRHRIFANPARRSPNRPAPPGQRRVPELDLVPVPANRRRPATVVIHRHHRHRPDRDAHRAVRPAVLVLPDPPRKRPPETLMHPPNPAGQHSRPATHDAVRELRRPPADRVRLPGMRSRVPAVTAYPPP